MSKIINVKRNLTEAHSWLGVIISIVLFLIFWAGAISLFKDDIQKWAELPHYPIDSSAADKPLLDIIEAKIAEYPLDTKEHLAVVVPSEDHPYYWMSIDLLSDEEEHEGEAEEHSHAEEHSKEIKINPKTGETIGGYYQFPWADFIYRLHYNLNFQPLGTYFIGIVTLFFLFAIFSGVYIHAKKIIPQFFSYRINKERTRWLDFHNVIGVMSLPFTLMYAITGLMFNLAIIYQIAFVMIIYKGDQDTLFADAGYPSFVAEAQTGEKLDMALALPLIDKAKQELGPATMLVFHNYGDENAVLQIFGQQRDHFSQLYEVFYRVKDGEVLEISDYEHFNAFRKGREVMSTLHFGNYAGTDLRILYFILGLAVAGMILAGNILWLNKRKKQKEVSQRVTRFTSNLMIGACSGFILATAVGVLAERIMPLSIENRYDLTVYIFSGVSFLVTLLAYFVTNKKRFISMVLYATTASLIVTVLADWLMFSKELLQLNKGGFHEPFAVQAGFIILSLCSYFIAKRLSKL